MKGKVLNIVYIIVGVILIFVDLSCPFPPVFGIPGIVWRLIIGIIGIFLLVTGLRNFFIKKK